MYIPLRSVSALFISARDGPPDTPGLARIDEFAHRNDYFLVPENELASIVSYFQSQSRFAPPTRAEALEHIPAAADAMAVQVGEHRASPRRRPAARRHTRCRRRSGPCQYAIWHEGGSSAVENLRGKRRH